MVRTSPTNKHANILIKQGYRVIAGVDEVGRGCIAGPVVVAAVVLPPRVRIPGVRDSKLLTVSQRRQLAVHIKRRAVAIGLGWASSELIDARGLTMALRLAGQKALSDLDLTCSAVLLDGHHNYLGENYKVQTVIKGDSFCLNIAAASIIAKVARDNYMAAQHRRYPGYGFNSHVGYGTPKHLAALEQGLTPLHRRLFAPISRLTGGASVN